MRRGQKDHAKEWEIMREVFAPGQDFQSILTESQGGPVICIQASHPRRTAPFLDALGGGAEGSTSHHFPGCPDGAR